MGRVSAWIMGGTVAMFLFICLVNSGLALALFGASDGVHRMVTDWRRIWVAHQMDEGDGDTEQAFARIYGPALGPQPTAEAIRSHVARDLEDGEPAVFDVVLARYIRSRFGAIDGRTLPAGVYLAAGPIGPDGWPGPLITHYLVFPRHGYLLVVPPRREGAWPEAYEATASLREEFRSTGDAHALYAEVQKYKPGAYDFPSRGEPVHDLSLISDDETEIAEVEARLSRFSERLDKRDLSYKLLGRNSNSTLACFLHVSGLAEFIEPSLGAHVLLRLRLPGVTLNDRLPC